MPYTSRVFACMKQLFTIQDAAAWTAHPTTGIKPTIYFGGTDDPPLESVVILGVPENPPDIDWSAIGGGTQDERFILRSQIDTVVSTLTQNDARLDVVVFDRLTTLADVYQGALRNETSGMPAGGFSLTEASPCRVLFHTVVSVRPEFYLTDRGVAGTCDIDTAFVCRI